MARLALDIDSIAVIRNVFGGQTPDPAQIAVLAELGGAESVVCYFRDDLKTVNERDVKVLREIVKSHFNIRCNVNESVVKKLLTIQPDMVTFVAPGGVADLEPVSLNLENYSAQLQDLIAELRANDIACSVLIDPQVSQLKLAGKLEFDYVELNGFAFATATDLDQELAELENLNSLSLAANRLGMGVNISGRISQDNLSEAAKIQFVDDLILGQAITTRALLIGFEQAFRDFISII